MEELVSRSKIGTKEWKDGRMEDEALPLAGSRDVEQASRMFYD